MEKKHLNWIKDLKTVNEKIMKNKVFDKKWWLRNTIYYSPFGSILISILGGYLLYALFDKEQFISMSIIAISMLIFAIDHILYYTKKTKREYLKYVITLLIFHIYHHALGKYRIKS